MSDASTPTQQPQLILDKMTAETLSAALDALDARATALKNDALLARIGRARSIKIADLRGRVWHQVRQIEIDLCGTEREVAEGRHVPGSAEVLHDKPAPKPEQKPSETDGGPADLEVRAPDGGAEALGGEAPETEKPRRRRR